MHNSYLMYINKHIFVTTNDLPCGEKSYKINNKITSLLKLMNHYTLFARQQLGLSNTEKLLNLKR